MRQSRPGGRLWQEAPMLSGTALKLAVIVTGVRHVGAIILDNAMLNRFLDHVILDRLTGMKGDDFGLDWSAGRRAPACLCIALWPPPAALPWLWPHASVPFPLVVRQMPPLLLCPDILSCVVSSLRASPCPVKDFFPGRPRMTGRDLSQNRRSVSSVSSRSWPSMKPIWSRGQ